MLHCAIKLFTAWAGLGFIRFEMHCIKSSVKSNKTVFKETSWFQPPLLERLVFLQFNHRNPRFLDNYENWYNL